MALAKNVEKRIWDVEQFDVNIKHGDGRDMRGDREGIPMYDYDRMTKNSMTVAEWKAQRFQRNYPGLEVDVLSGTGETVPGNTLLANVRDSYAED